jgi:hypothetical protein
VRIRTYDDKGKEGGAACKHEPGIGRQELSGSISDKQRGCLPAIEDHVPIGGPQAMAVNALAKAGFASVYNIIDGIEGDKVDDSGSIYHGKRMRDGWKNSGSPWTCDVNPELLWNARY